MMRKDPFPGENEIKHENAIHILNDGVVSVDVFPEAKSPAGAVYNLTRQDTVFRFPYEAGAEPIPVEKDGYRILPLNADSLAAIGAFLQGEYEADVQLFQNEKVQEI